MVGRWGIRIVIIVGKGWSKGGGLVRLPLAGLECCFDRG